jgi:hypothetical protein
VFGRLLVASAAWESLPKIACCQVLTMAVFVVKLVMFMAVVIVVVVMVVAISES